MKYLKPTLLLLLLGISLTASHAGILQSIQLVKKICQSEVINKELAKTELPFELINGKIIVTLTIEANGKTYPARLLLDSGAPTTLFHSFIAAKGIPVQGTEKSDDILHTADGAKNSAKYLASNLVFDLNLLQVKKENTLVISTTLGLCEHIDGILGVDLMQNFSVLIDFEQKNITLFNKEKFNPDPYAFDGIWKFDIYSPFQKTPTFDLDLNGKSVYTILDLGYNGDLWVQCKKANSKTALHFLTDTSKQIIGTFGAVSTINGPFEKLDTNYMYKNARLQYQRFAIDSINISLSINPKAIEEKANLGTGVLKHYLLAIDWHKKRVYLKQQRPFSAERIAPKPYFIISYLPSSQHFRVRALSQDSEWNKKGLKTSDTVVAINGVSLPEMARRYGYDQCSIAAEVDSLENNINKLTIMRAGQEMDIE